MSVQLPHRLALSLVASLAFGSAAQADLRVSFYEGAPKDRFKIENTGGCAILDSSVAIDLSRSQGGLIFDVTATGQGVEVYQPFEIVQGAEALARTPTVLDGQTKVELDIKSLAPGEAIVFTIDVDDTIGQRAITVTGSEMTGAVTSLSNSIMPISAVFTSGPQTVIPTPKDCAAS